MSLRKLWLTRALCLGAVVLRRRGVHPTVRWCDPQRLRQREDRASVCQSASRVCDLRIGELDYAVGANRLVAQSSHCSATNTTLKIGRISLTGVRWARLLWGTSALADVLANASLEATNLDVEFPQAHYGIRCTRLRASVPGSELIAEGTELQPLARRRSILRRARLSRPRGFMWSCLSAKCWAWRMANCFRESRTGPGRSTFPDPPSMRCQS
jgi:hypothetical protein